MSYDIPLLERFRQLTASQKRIAKLCADGANDETMLQTLSTNANQLRLAIGEIHQRLELPGMASTYAIRQKIGNVQQQFELWQEELALGAPKDSLPASANPRGSSEGDEREESDDEEVEAPKDLELAQPKPPAPPPDKPAEPQSALPDVALVAHKIGNLKERWKTTLGLMLSVKRGEKDKVASSLGIGTAALAMRMGRIYKALGLTHLDLREKRQLVRLAWTAYQNGETGSVAVPAPPPAPPAPPTPETDADADPPEQEAELLDLFRRSEQATRESLLQLLRVIHKSN